MLTKTTGREFFYSVSSLIPPKYMVEDSLTENIEFYVDWVSKNTDELADMVYDNLKGFIAEMEKLYKLLCDIYAHWLEMEASMILRLTEINDGELCKPLVEPFIANLRTLAIDIQMAQSKGFDAVYRQRNEIDRCRNVISSLDVIVQLVESGDFMKAFEIAISIDELKGSEYDLPLMSGLATRNANTAVRQINSIEAAYKEKIETVIHQVTETVTLKKILIVDDMPEILTTLSHMLKEYYQVFAFTSGKQALDFLDFKKQKPDAFILDVEMPEIDGFALAERIRSRAKHEKTPILFLTGNSTREVFMKSMMYGAKSFLVKPVHKDIVIAKLSACLNA